MLVVGLPATQRRWYVIHFKGLNCVLKPNTIIAGFLIPLSGGLDSASTATLVFAGAYEKEGWLPKTPQELTGRLL
jgi:NH3-dependent NAD+ synthetase